MKNTGIGVNWYLAPDEDHNADGKHIGFIADPRYNGCDDALRDSLKDTISRKLSVLSLENRNLIPGALYCHELLGPPSRTFSRGDWHVRALQVPGPAEAVFLAPDNGLIVKSVSAGSAKRNKYILPSERIDYYFAGKSVIFYNHRSREKESAYVRRFDWLHTDLSLKEAVITGLTFRRGAVRDFIFVLRPDHVMRILGAVEEMLEGPWRNHFKKLDL